jgi:pyruvate ferredoxin oxidoreductase alpha subunit
MEVSLAVTEAVTMADVDVVSAYPITPQTHIVESLSKKIADGELDAEFVCVESEHSALSVLLGSAATGARTFTTTAGQGLELMHEVVYVASSMRLPIVMVIANRALSAPLSVWCDHSDAMSVRDTGWVQVFVENSQESVDHVFWAYRVAEDPEVLLPVMIHMDGFHLTHVVEPVLLPDQEQVERYLLPLNYPYPLDPDRPVTMGGYGPPYIYAEARKAHEEALTGSMPTLFKGWEEFNEVFGRQYKPVETYRMDGARIAIMTMGSIGETASMVIDELRGEGLEVGHIQLRLWRPFPFAQLREAVRDLDLLVVLDRCLSTGGPGPVCSEVRSALYREEPRPDVIGFIAGLGGRDIMPEQIRYMLERAQVIASEGSEVEYEIIGVRE